MDPQNYDTFYSVSYAYFLYYLRNRDIQPLADSDDKLAAEKVLTRNKKAEYFDKSQDYLEKALKIRHQDYKIQLLAILLYFEKLKDLPNRESRNQITETNTLKTKIEFHGKQYLIYKPKSKKIDKKIKDILDIVKGY